MCGLEVPAAGRKRGRLTVIWAFQHVRSKYQMTGECYGFLTPMPQSVKSTDANAAKTRLIGPFRAIQPPVKILLRSGKMDLRIGGAVIGLLVNNKSLFAPALTRGR